MPPLPGPVVLFDGVCNLCNGTVVWLIKRDTGSRLRFAFLQSLATRQIAKEAEIVEKAEADMIGNLTDSIILIDAEGVHTRSTAAIRIAQVIGFPYSLLRLGMLIPRPIRDAAYNQIATNRYRWFGRKDSCTVPTSDLLKRFLDADETDRLRRDFLGDW